MTFAAVYTGNSSPSALWYLTRGTGLVTLVLLTAVVVLGIVEVERVSSPTWPRFLIDAVHRRAAVLAVAFLTIHIATSVLDPFAPIGWLDAIVPLHSAYRPVWLGLGAVAFDLLLAVLLTSLLRERVGHPRWRAAHWLAYACWPVAVMHAVGTGSDVKRAWMLAIVAVCIAAVALAALVRVRSSRTLTPVLRGVATAAVVLFPLGLLLWLPGGPLGSDWARRAGTPVSLLPHARAEVSNRGGGR